MPLQRSKHFCLELPRCGHDRVFPHCQEVRKDVYLLMDRQINLIHSFNNRHFRFFFTIVYIYFPFLPDVSLCRGTGFGFCNALCKLAAVLGNLIFGSLVGITKAVPILMASSVLVGGGLVGLRLPDTRANVLM